MCYPFHAYVSNSKMQVERFRGSRCWNSRDTWGSCCSNATGLLSHQLLGWKKQFRLLLSGVCQASRDGGQAACPKPQRFIGRQTPVLIVNKGLGHAGTDGNNMRESVKSTRELEKRQMELHKN